MRIRLAVPEGLNEQERKAMLDSALETMVLAQAPLFGRGKLPGVKESIKRGLRWKPEPPGDEHFDLLKTAVRRGWGDCDDLAPARAAELRGKGIDPEARAVVRKSGPNRWHALVERSNGEIEDPSRWAGMGSVGGDDYRGPFWNPMFGGLSLATLPLQQGWGGRIDLPSQELPMMYSALTRGATPAQAIVRGCHGLREVCGQDADLDDLLRLAGIEDLLRGVPAQVVGDALEQVGFFGALAPLIPAATSLAAPVLSKLLPGAAPPGAPPGGGGGGGGVPSGATMSCPGGPIIVRF